MLGSTVDAWRDARCLAQVLNRQDFANVEAGVCPLPADHDGSLKMLLHRSRLFFEDLPAIRRRRESGDHSEVLSEETRGKRPRYYLQNFQFQSGVWITDESAQLPSAFGHDTWQLGFVQRVCNGPRLCENAMDDMIPF
jgi:hypothetical protein